MLALAAASQGAHDPSQILFILAVLVGVVFWRGLLKFACIGIVVMFAVLFFAGAWSLMH